MNFDKIMCVCVCVRKAFRTYGLNPPGSRRFGVFGQFGSFFVIFKPLTCFVFKLLLHIHRYSPHPHKKSLVYSNFALVPGKRPITVNFSFAGLHYRRISVITRQLNACPTQEIRKIKVLCGNFPGLISWLNFSSVLRECAVGDSNAP